MTRPKAYCTWGDGPDVLLQTQDPITKLSDAHDLTAYQALELAEELRVCAQRCFNLEHTLEPRFEMYSGTWCYSNHDAGDEG